VFRYCQVVQLCTHKYSPSVQDVYSSTVYLYMNKVQCLDERGPFRCPERKFAKPPVKELTFHQLISIHLIIKSTLEDNLMVVKKETDSYLRPIDY
jgi:hypothetical protein